MTVSVWHHVYVGGAGDDPVGVWEEPVSEFFDALDAGGLMDEIPCVNVGIVGHPGIRLTAYEFMNGISRKPVFVHASVDHGFEQVTLHRLAAHAAVNDWMFAYGHTKSSWADTQPSPPQRSDHIPFNRAWRRSMTTDIFVNWRDRVAELEAGADATGGHRIHEPHGNGYFGGNFWLAKGRHIRSLPPLLDDHRHRAEGWIAENPDAVLHDCRPGWPDWLRFAPGSML